MRPALHYNVSLEPALQPLSGEVLPTSASTAQEARVDIKAGAFWSKRRHETAFFDVRVSTHMHVRIVTTRCQCLTHEQEKRRLYEARRARGPVYPLETAEPSRNYARVPGYKKKIQEKDKKKTRKEKKNEQRRNQYARVRRYKITSTLGLLVRGDPQSRARKFSYFRLETTTPQSMYIKLRSKANKDSTAYRANERKQKQNIYINKIKYNKYKKIKIS